MSQLLSNIAKQKEPDVEVRRVRTLRLISRSAVAISLAYIAAYLLSQWSWFAVYSGFFFCFYGTIAFLAQVSAHPAIPVVFIAGAIINLTFSACFLTAEAGVHYYLLVCPAFAMMTIRTEQRVWLWGLNVVSLTSMGIVEFIRSNYVPPFDVQASADMVQSIRAASIVVTGLFISGVFWRFYEDIQRARIRLGEAHARSESLLLNILPQVIAKRLKLGSRQLADDHDEVTVLFADIVGFTALSSRLSASELVSLLNAYFSAFDLLVDTHQLEKIKTIGDAYMVAGGVPSSVDSHVDRTLQLAVDMQTAVRALNERLGQDLQLRIGIHMGPVTAGVIGERKFIYDLWGDTVNIASRMESTGVVDRIQVTPEVAHASKGGFRFESRGLIAIKGKGEMETYLLDFS